MKYKIQPKKIKIYDTVEANTVDIVVTQDDGLSCSIKYVFSNVQTTNNTEDSQPVFKRSSESYILGNGFFTLKDGNYTVYNSASDRMQYAVGYICNELGLTLQS